MNKHKLRETIPQRRPNPKTVARYGSYKDDLRNDFNRRCGYCDDEDRWTGKKLFFQIDHFVPRKYLKTISEAEYGNLVYSCFFCNNSKRADWPTNDEMLHNDGHEGYIDVCDPVYDEQFYRDSTGEIVACTELGHYMYCKLKLFLKRHAILWKLSRIRDQIREIEKIMKEKKSLGSNEKLLRLKAMHYDYFEQLTECNET